MTVNGKTAEESRIILTQLMGPADANFHGNVHGGLIMKLCDEAGGMAAAKHARRQAVTVTVDSMTFHSPVHVGDLITVTAEVSWVGRTSLETRVVVTTEEVISGKVTHSNTAYFVYVALDERGMPAQVTPLICETEESQARFERAALRQRARLQRRRQEAS